MLQSKFEWFLKIFSISSHVFSHSQAIRDGPTTGYSYHRWILLYGTYVIGVHVKNDTGFFGNWGPGQPDELGENFIIIDTHAGDVPLWGDYGDTSDAKRQIGTLCEVFVPPKKKSVSPRFLKFRSQRNSLSSKPLLFIHSLLVTISFWLLSWTRNAHFLLSVYGIDWIFVIITIKSAG